MSFNIDQFSFWVGFAAGIVSLWMLRLLKPTFKDLGKALGSRVSAVQSGLSESIERRYRQDIVGIAQSKHIAAPLFSLDEVGIPVRLMAPPPRVIPDDELPPDDTFSLVIPYMPDWPEMAATYNTPTMSIEEALEGGVDLVIIGKPGSGKSFALNQLATRFARRDKELGDLSELIPVMVHVGDISLESKKGKLLDALYNALYDKVSAIVEAQLPAFLENIFEKNKAILLLDGLDELPPEAHDQYLDLLEKIKEKYPETRIVITGSTDNIPYREGLNFFVIPIAAWDTPRRRELIYKWDELWDKHIRKESWAKALPEPIDAVLIDGWMFKESSNFNPLFLTLRLWATYAGDLMGSSVSDTLDAYVRRMSADVENSRKALEQLATQAVISLTPMVKRKQAGKFVAQFEDPSAASDLEPEILEETEDILGDEEEDEDVDLIDEDMMDLDDLDIPEEVDTSEKKEKAVSARGVRRMLPEMVNNYLLTYRADAKIGFTLPVVAGYLAGCGLANMGGEQELVSQPNWVGKSLSLQYLASQKDVSALANQLLSSQSNGVMHSTLLSVGAWPSTAPKDAQWKGDVMRALAAAINEANLSLGLRGRVLTALANSGDVGVVALFRQLLSSPQADVQMLGALGSGIVQDEKATSLLDELLYSPVPNVRRAACLALVAIDTIESIEMVAGALLQGEEDARRAAAEALARHPDEGHPILKEGAQLEDLLVRRAVTFGLAWIKEPWARELLEKLQLEDDQWMVRSSAGQVLDMLDKPNQFIPRPLTELVETPWLITFASERGMGLAPGKTSWDMLKLALKEGNEDQRLAAMEHYRYHPEQSISVRSDLHNMVNGNDAEMREAAYLTLWQIEASGVSIT